MGNANINNISLTTNLSDGSSINLKSILDNNKLFSLQDIDIKDVRMQFSDRFQINGINGDSTFKTNYTKKDLETLDRSIKLYGQIMPILVHKVDTINGEKFIVIDGLKRLYLATSKRQSDTIKALVINSDLRQSVPLVRLLSNEKVFKSPASIVDEADEIRRKILSFRDSQIEDILGLNMGELSLLSIMLDEENIDPSMKKIFDKYKNGTVTLSKTKQDIENNRYKNSNKKKVEESSDSAENGNNENLNENQGESQGIQNEGLTDTVSSIEDTVKKETEPNQQFIGDRKILNQDLRKRVLARDSSTCQVCGLGGEHEPFLASQLEIHHMIEVQYGGTDDVNNLITLCSSCHKLITNYGQQKAYILQKRHAIPFNPTESELNESPNYWLIIVLGSIEKKAYEFSRQAIEEKSFEVFQKMERKQLTIGQAIEQLRIRINFDFVPYELFKKGTFDLYKAKKDIGFELIKHDWLKQAEDYQPDETIDGTSGKEVQKSHELFMLKSEITEEK